MSDQQPAPFDPRTIEEAAEILPDEATTSRALLKALLAATDARGDIPRREVEAALMSAIIQLELELKGFQVATD